MRFRRAAFVVVWAGAVGTARAEPPSVVSIDYAAPAGCPRGDAFAAELATRAPRARLVPPGPRTRSLVVRIAARGRAVGGRVTVREPDGTETERAVAGDSCAEVVTALALIAAVAVDPTAATTEAAPTSPTTNSNTTTTTTTATPGAPQPTSSTTAPQNGQSGDTSRDEPSNDRASRDREGDRDRDRAHDDDGRRSPPADPLDPREARDGRWNVALGVQGGALGGVSPDALLLFSVFAEVAREPAAVLAPAVRLRFERTGSGTVTSGGANAEYAWTAASLDACPIALAASRFSVRPCARIEGGTLEVTAVDVLPSRSAVRPWLALGPVARGRVMIAGPVFAELEVAGDLALVRDRFFIEPSQTVFRAPLLGWSASGGAGFAFR